MKVKENEVFYLDDNNNFADVEHATHAIGRVYDDEGSLVMENFISMNQGPVILDYKSELTQEQKDKLLKNSGFKQK